MTARIRGPLVAACLIALTFAASAPVTANADTTSTVGWVRLAHLSPNVMAVDWYLSPAGGASASVVVKDVGYGTLSPYQTLAPGDYVASVRAAGSAETSNAETTVHVAVAAGQAYTVAGVGTASVPMLRVLSDKLDVAQGKAGVRVIDASQRNPTVSVDAGGAAIVTDLRFPSVSDYQLVDPGLRAVRATTRNGGATAQVNFVAGSTYTVAVLDGTGIAPQIVDLSDASGVSVPPRGGVSTGFGGMEAQQGGSGSVFPVTQVVLLIVAVGGVAYAISRRRK